MAPVPMCIGTKAQWPSINGYALLMLFSEADFVARETG